MATTKDVLNLAAQMANESFAFTKTETPEEKAERVKRNKQEGMRKARAAKAAKSAQASKPVNEAAEAKPKVFDTTISRYPVNPSTIVTNVNSNAHSQLWVDIFLTFLKNRGAKASGDVLAVIKAADETIEILRHQGKL